MGRVKSLYWDEINSYCPDCGTPHDEDGPCRASADTRRMAETHSGSGRSPSGAVPSVETGDAQPLGHTDKGVRS